ncbi:hypothetical protein NYR97_09635 [Xanthomonas hydrangeae]|uniref:Uncharacterized protein n=1 Tax=Xanthomonas hydrangeae TaxID=2775159 RepID=A0AAU0BG79_9XANT|nr:hypothetical protein [Xanthomonas hydrangeae]WOB51580.1 hypothetical protein NYR97_09635 [Xanthomonas hydrangeae]
MFEKKAYIAMLIFLEDYWERNGQPDALGVLLGSMNPLEDGVPADSAIWNDWLEAVAKSESEWPRQFTS